DCISDLCSSDVPRYVEGEAAGEEPIRLVREHARGKARSVVARVSGKPVLGVDTGVVCSGRVYGKPADEDEARAMLDALSGRMHEVVSGLCLLGSEVEVVEHDVTRVEFRSLSSFEIDAYLAAGEWRGRAGAY